ncbi:MAG: hypothetical protein WEB04_07825 [Dehalococcoidia bacterium]
MHNTRLYVTVGRGGAAALFLALCFLVACRSEADTRYEVIVHFNASVTQPDLDFVAAYLRGYDPDVDFLIQETFPPTGVARFKTNGRNVCEVIEAELETMSYIDSVDCAKAPDGIPIGGGTPVSSTAEGR